MGNGYFHSYNVLLFRVLDALMWEEGIIKKDELSTRELAAILGLQPTDITARIKKYLECRYVVRSRKKYVDPTTGRKVRLMKITKSGIKTYMVLKKRIKLGFELNRQHRRVEKVDTYFGLTKNGVDNLGITQETVDKMNALLKSLAKEDLDEDIE
jgi:DNA-binding MarR family transcriptional regulator